MKKINRIFLLLFLSMFWIMGRAQNVSQWPHAISYEIFVQSFADADGNRIGDFRGMTSKLDYLQELGVGSVWLMPINPSPSYHKYDVTDYYGVHPDYGTMDEFKTFVREAHKRNIKVVIDLVINHCSSKHPWFLEAIKNNQSDYFDYFVWTHKDDPQVSEFVRNVEEDSKNRNRWNVVAGSDYLYYSYFGKHMPDLNFDNPKLRDEMFKIGRYWLVEVGIDGFRLDAARHIFPDERAHESQVWWQYFLSEMKKVKPDVYLVGEVWASVDKVAPYLKGIPALFNFDLASLIKNAVNNGKGDSLAFTLQTMEAYYSAVNPDFIDATFLSNHDQNRVMSTLDNSIEKAKVAAAILLTLPGSPYLYYGEEIGMKGVKPDEHIREPFLWDSKSKDTFRTNWLMPAYSLDSTMEPMTTQAKMKSSLLSTYKSLISLRNRSTALTFGSLEPLQLGKDELCAFIRKSADEEFLVIHNLTATTMVVQIPQGLRSFTHLQFSTTASLKMGIDLNLAPYATIILSK